MHDRIYRIQSVRSINSICCTPFESNIHVRTLQLAICCTPFGSNINWVFQPQKSVKYYLKSKSLLNKMRKQRMTLSDNPQLAQALLLIQMEFNLVKSQDIQALTRYAS
eukprot:360911_1